MSSVAAHGFAGWVSSFVAFFAFLAWAFVPDAALKQLGWTYLPSKYWAVALPVWLCVAVVTVSLLYVTVNMTITAPLESLNTVTDSHAVAVQAPSAWDPPDAHQVPPIGDLSIGTVNKLLFLKREASKQRAQADLHAHRAELRQRAMWDGLSTSTHGAGAFRAAGGAVG